MVIPICPRHSSLETLVKLMNTDHKTLSQCLKANKLSLNATKAELITFHSSSKNADHSLKFKLNGKRLTQTDTVNYLGFLLNDHLLCSKQIDHFATKLNQAIVILSKFRGC